MSDLGPLASKPLTNLEQKACMAYRPTPGTIVFVPFSRRGQEPVPRTSSDNLPAGDLDQEPGEVRLVLTKAERGLICAIQKRDPAVIPKIDWKGTAEAIGFREDYLKALSRIPLSEGSYDVPRSSIDRALYSVSLDSRFGARMAQIRQAEDLG